MADEVLVVAGAFGRAKGGLDPACGTKNPVALPATISGDSDGILRLRSARATAYASLSPNNAIEIRHGLPVAERRLMVAGAFKPRNRGRTGPSRSDV